MGTITKEVLAINDIQAARKRGDPIYEVKARNNQTTLEFSPFKHIIKECVDDSIGCLVYRCDSNGTKHRVLWKQNNKILQNDINLQVK